jgi:hypothetical protein
VQDHDTVCGERPSHVDLRTPCRRVARCMTVAACC